MRAPGFRVLGIWACAGALAGMLGLGVVRAQDMKPEAKALRALRHKLEANYQNCIPKNQFMIFLDFQKCWREIW